MGPDNQNNFRNNVLGDNMPIMGPQPTPAPASDTQQPVMGVPQPLPDAQPLPVQPTQPEPVQPVPDVQPLPMQPVQQEPVSMQPDAAQLEPMQPMPESQPMPGMQPASGIKSKKNLIMIGAIAGVVLIILIVVIIVILNSGKGSSQPANPIPEPELSMVPTPELAESVCEERGGVFKSAEDYGLDLSQNSNKYYSAMYSCEKYSDGQAATLPDDFAYEIYFVSEELVDDYWSEIKTSFSEEAEGTNLASAYTMLENSDEYIKGHVAGEYIAAYQDAMIMVSAGSVKTAEDILAELGFPDRNRADSDEEGADEGEGEGDNSDVAKRDEERQKDYTNLTINIDSYYNDSEGDNYSLVENIFEKEGPIALDASKLINKTGKDPNGKKYELKSYTYEKWQSDGSVAPAVSETAGGSQVFVITGANCGGTDANGNSMPQKYDTDTVFVVYGYLENGNYFCLDNNSIITTDNSL